MLSSAVEELFAEVLNAIARSLTCQVSDRPEVEPGEPRRKFFRPALSSL